MLSPRSLTPAECHEACPPLVAGVWGQGSRRCNIGDLRDLVGELACRRSHWHFSVWGDPGEVDGMPDASIGPQ